MRGMFFSHLVLTDLDISYRLFHEYIKSQYFSTEIGKAYVWAYSVSSISASHLHKQLNYALFVLVWTSLFFTVACYFLFCTQIELTTTHIIIFVA